MILLKAQYKNNQILDNMKENFFINGPIELTEFMKIYQQNNIQEKNLQIISDQYKKFKKLFCSWPN